MPIITRGEFGRFAPRATPTIADAIVLKADEVLPRWQINTPGRLHMLFAMMDVESAHFTKLFEDMDYSAKRLVEVWPKRFPTTDAAAPYAHNPQALANKVYGGRLGNVEPNDGWLCRGTGLMGTTGRSGFAKAAKALGVSVDRCRAMMTDPDHMLDCAVAVFVAWGCLPYADQSDVEGCTLLINGGRTGLADRQTAFKRAQAVWPRLGAPDALIASRPVVIASAAPVIPSPGQPAILREAVPTSPTLWARFKSLFTGKAA